MTDLLNKKILITGGARVGQFVAEELIAAGAQVSMTYHTSPDEVHKNAQGYPVDITDEKSVHSLMAASTPLDGLVNMVSVFKEDDASLSFDQLEKSFRINAFGNMLISQLFAEHAQSRKLKNAPIVSFIDWAVDHPYQKYTVYLSAKAALRHYLMALQSSFHGIVRVVNIHPGMILEPLDFPPEEKQEIVRNTPTQSIGTPEEAAKLVRVALELDYLVDNIYLAGGQQWRHRL